MSFRNKLNACLECVRQAIVLGANLRSRILLLKHFLILPRLTYRGIAKTNLKKLDTVKIKTRRNHVIDFQGRVNGLDLNSLLEFYWNDILACLKGADSAQGAIFDIGANIGIASIALSELFPESKVYSFEPQNDNFQLLKRNTSTFPQIFPFELALGSKSGICSFEVNEKDPRGGKLADRKAGEPPTGEVAVKVVTLDAFVSENNVEKPSVVKMDVEGFELEVLKGGIETLKGVRYLHLETHSEELTEKCTDFLRSLNFKVTTAMEYQDGACLLCATRNNPSTNETVSPKTN